MKNILTLQDLHPEPNTTWRIGLFRLTYLSLSTGINTCETV